MFITLMIDAVVTLFGNIMLFCLIPLIWWFIFHRKKQSFFEFIGLIKPKLEKPLWFLVLFLVLYFFFTMGPAEDIIFFFVDKEKLAEVFASEASSRGEYVGLGFQAILPAMIVKFLANGLCEEIFFRGFLIKRLETKLKPIVSVVVVSALFAAMHNLLFLVAGLPLGIDYHIASFTFVFIGSALLGILNEELFNGSIIPSSILHGLGNFIVTIKTLF